MNERLARLNNIPMDGKHKSDKERILELEAENSELKARVEDTETALVELADIIAGE